MNAKSSNKLINIILILLFFLSVSSIAYLSFPQKNAGSSIQNSKKDLTFQTLDNQEISSFNLKNKIVLVNFWASWCTPCRIEIPSLIELKNTYPSDSFEVIGVSTDDSPDVATRFSNFFEINYPVVMHSQELTYFFGPVSSIPRTFILDKDFNITYDLKGLHSFQDLQTIIDSLLAD